MQCEVCGEREATVVYIVAGDRVAPPPRRFDAPAMPVAEPTLCLDCARARIPDFAQGVLAQGGRPSPWEPQPLGVARRTLAAVAALLFVAIALWAPSVRLPWWPVLSTSMGACAVSAAWAAWRGRESILYPRGRGD